MLGSAVTPYHWIKITVSLILEAVCICAPFKSDSQKIFSFEEIRCSGMFYVRIVRLRDWRRDRRRGLLEVTIIASTNMVYVVTDTRLGTHNTGNMCMWHSVLKRLEVTCTRARVSSRALRALIRLNDIGRACKIVPET